MKKIPTLFVRDHETGKILHSLNPMATWVTIAGEGVATRKLDGTCCMILDGKLYKRYEVKPGKIPPPDFTPADFDEATGKTVGWVPVGDGPEDKWHREGAVSRDRNMAGDGTYELVGPKINGNPEKTTCHTLLAHSWAERYPGCPRDFDGLREWLSTKDIEGIVWHHPDGRMAKIKKKDFGLKREP